MNRTATILALAATALIFTTSGCGGDEKKPSVDDQKIAAVREDAPSWPTTGQQLLQAMDSVCQGQPLDRPAGVTDYDYGYVLGLALSTCKSG